MSGSFACRPPFFVCFNTEFLFGMDFTFFWILVAATIVPSFLCSLTEAAIYSVPLGYVKHMAESGSRVGKILLNFKSDIGRPVVVILVINTISNSAGPALAGALVTRIWGDRAVGWFAAGITLAILIFCEITPKIAGVNHCRPIARFTAIPLYLLVRLFGPITWISGWLSRALKPEVERPTVSHEEVLSMAAIGTQEGSLDHLEGSVIRNVIGLDRVLVRDVLTPRVVVFRMPQNTPITSMRKELPEISFTRIPIYDEDDPDQLSHYVMQLDIYRAIMRGQDDKRLIDLARPLTTVPELMSVDKLLLQMFEKKEQLCAVVDEYGGLAGIITLEDVIEEIVGHEIIDEYDTVGDLRGLAALLQSSRRPARK